MLNFLLLAALNVNCHVQATGRPGLLLKSKLSSFVSLLTSSQFCASVMIINKTCLVGYVDYLGGHEIAFVGWASHQRTTHLTVFSLLLCTTRSILPAVVVLLISTSRARRLLGQILRSVAEVIPCLLLLHGQVLLVNYLLLRCHLLFVMCVVLEYIAIPQFLLRQLFWDDRGWLRDRGLSLRLGTSLLSLHSLKLFSVALRVSSLVLLYEIALGRRYPRAFPYHCCLLSGLTRSQSPTRQYRLVAWLLIR